MPPQNGNQLAKGTRQVLPLLLLMCGPGLVKFYMYLLRLQVAVANMASHSLSVYLLDLCILGAAASSRVVGSPSSWP